MAVDLDLQELNDILKSSGLSGFRIVREDDPVMSAPIVTKMSNSLTAIENSFNRIYTYSANFNKLQEAENRRLEMISRENTLEKMPGRMESTAAGCTIQVANIISAVSVLDKSLRELGDALENMPLGGSGFMPDIPDIIEDIPDWAKKIPRWMRPAAIAEVAAPLAIAFGAPAMGALAVSQLREDKKEGMQSKKDNLAPYGVGVVYDQPRDDSPMGRLLGIDIPTVRGYNIGGKFYTQAQINAADERINPQLYWYKQIIAVNGPNATADHRWGWEREAVEYLQHNPRPPAPGPLAGARARGGPVERGKPYLVGERGPEIFTPDSSGNVSPRRRAGPPTILKIVVVNQRPSQTQMDVAQREFADRIIGSMQKSVVEQRAAQERAQSAAVATQSAKNGSFMNFISSLFDRFKNFLGLGDRAGDNGGGGSNLPPAGSTANAMTAFNFFKSKGWTDVQAAAMVGVMQRESGANLDPNAHNTAGGNIGAWGIAQWRGTRQAGQQVERALGRSSLRGTTFEQQLQYIQWELENTHGRARRELSQAQTIEQAVNAYLSFYEGVPGDNVTQRISNAWAILNGTRDMDMATGSTNMTGGIGRVTSDFGSRTLNGRVENHPGTDIAAPGGTRVYSVSDGVVEYSNRDVQPFRNYGNAVVIRSSQDSNVHFLYGHFSRRAVAAGTRVSRGQLIGFVGSTGKSSGNHLHFEIRRGENMGTAQTIRSRQTYESNKWIVGGSEGGENAPRPEPATLTYGDTRNIRAWRLSENGRFVISPNQVWFDLRPPSAAAENARLNSVYGNTPRMAADVRTFQGRRSEILSNLSPQRR